MIGNTSLIFKSTFKKLATFSGLGLLILQLSGCGFHLRGLESTGALPFKSVQIQASNNVRDDLVTALKRQLKNSQVAVLEDQTAEVQIQLNPTGYKATTTSTSSGDTTSQLLKMSQSFQVIDLQSGEKMLSATSEVYRDRTIIINAVLASDSELRSIQKSMSSELARQVLNRIRIAVKVEKGE
ncbi:LPS assembly lipoprotein LptE [Thiomicrorhabdus sp. Milos-T2]|uniref:LPS-assembly lipoprotein LptE n=1 Tax=Thiomicrorhabdus sp. Milos-T2 TaxID=90814 RepID=UPI000493DE9F|nr:LPS assembly lipoprotein LptE [Thiomicrorhabdus sp. Milos-T2]